MSMLKVKRFFLEINSFDEVLKNVNLPSEFNILKEKKNFEINKFFYKQVGIDHYWRDRLIWTDKEWLKYVANKYFETWVIRKEKELVGFYEQEFHPKTNEVELINMGILKEFRGNQLGSSLLVHAINKARQLNPNRLWVHTCSLDHKFALQNYKSKGFKIFREEEIDFVA